MTSDSHDLPSVAMRPETASIEFGEHGMAPKTFDDIARVCMALSASGVFSKRKKDRGQWVEVPLTWQECFVRVQMGAELGFSAIQSMFNIYDVYGRPHIQVEMAWGKVIASGELEDSGELWEGQGKSRKCTFWAKPKGRSKIERSFSIQDAIQAGLVKDSGGWEKYPDRLLYQRSKGFVVKDGFPHIMHGIGVADDGEIGASRARNVTARARVEEPQINRAILALTDGDPPSIELPKQEPEIVEAEMDKTRKQREELFECPECRCSPCAPECSLQGEIPPE